MVWRAPSSSGCTREGGRSRGKVGGHGEGGRARGKVGDHARRWEITRGGRSRGKVGDHAGRWENTRKAYLPTSQVHPYCNSKKSFLVVARNSRATSKNSEIQIPLPIPLPGICSFLRLILVP